MFVDRVSVTLKAGDGGNGRVSFRREKFISKGGPDGGDGGDGGNIVLRASRNQNTLAAFRYKKQQQAKDGGAGGERRMHGRNGENLELNVPIGTVLLDSDGNTLADLLEDGQTVIVAQGGKGGFGNAHFVSSTRQAPRIAEKGEAGQFLEGTFELKMIADVGIIGLPNAGKSTLLSVVSNAKPEIADYPFTTLHPNLGVVDINKTTSLLLADIPGLIEGASHGKGLGDEFLRHVERTSVLLHLVDAYNDDIKAAYKTIIKELADYKIDLSKKPQIVALTKIEGLDKKALNNKIAIIEKLAPKGTLVLAFSSSSRQGLDELLRALEAKVKRANLVNDKKKSKQQLPVIGLKPVDDDWAVRKDGDVFVVTGRKIERFAGRTIFGDQASEERLADIMRKMGIMRELERQDIELDQTIIIGQPAIGELEY